MPNGPIQTCTVTLFQKITSRVNSHDIPRQRTGPGSLLNISAVVFLLTCICLMAGVPTTMTLLHDLQTTFFIIMTSQGDNRMRIRRRAYRNTIIVLLMGDNLHRHESHICMMMMMLELIKCICFFGQQLFAFIFWRAKKI